MLPSSIWWIIKAARSKQLRCSSLPCRCLKVHVLYGRKWKNSAGKLVRVLQCMYSEDLWSFLYFCFLTWSIIFMVFSLLTFMSRDCISLSETNNQASRGQQSRITLIALHKFIGSIMLMFSQDGTSQPSHSPSVEPSTASQSTLYTCNVLCPYTLYAISSENKTKSFLSLTGNV